MANPLLTVFAELRGDGSKLQADAVKAGEAAGMAAGLAASKSMGPTFKKGLGSALSSFGTGILQGMGQEAFRGIESAISGAVNAIPDLMAKGRDYLAVMEDIRDATGSSAESISAFTGALTILGVPLDGMGTKLKAISTAIADDSSAFTKLGIATRDSNGLQRDTIAIIDDVRSKLAGYASGADKSRIATQLFGKSGMELLDFLSLSDAQFASVTDRVRSFGLIIGGDTLDEIEKAKRAEAELDLAFTGLGVTLQAELGPTVRSVIGAITQFIAENSAKIRDAIKTVAAAIAGLVEGLTGVPLGGTWLDTLGDLSPEVTQTDQLGQRLGELNTQRDALLASKPKHTAATNAESKSIDAQTKAIDKQIAALDRQDAAAEKVYQRQIAGLAAVYQAQLDALDAEERRARIAAQAEDDAIALAAALETLRKARAKASTGEYDVTEVQAAQAGVDEARKRQADNAAQRDRDAKRAAIESTKAYIESIGQLEANADNRKALANTLKNREKVLSDRLAAAQERGDLEEVSRLRSMLDAIDTAEARNNAAIRTAAKKTELETTKAELADLKASLAGTSAASSDTQKKWEADWKKNLEATAKVEAALARLYGGKVWGLVTGGGGGGGRAKPPLGSGGGLTGALEETKNDWVRIGNEMKTIFDDGKGGGVLGAVNSVIAALNQLSTIGLPDALTWLMGLMFPLPTEMQKINSNLLHGRPLDEGVTIPPGGGGATGGVIPPGSWGWVGEAGMERATSLPGGGTLIEPTRAPAALYGQPVVLHVDMDGQTVARLVDRRLALLPRH